MQDAKLFQSVISPKGDKNPLSVQSYTSNPCSDVQQPAPETLYSKPLDTTHKPIQRAWVVVLPGSMRVLSKNCTKLFSY